MQKALSYILSVLYYPVFVLILILFHPVQWISYNWFGYQAHKRTVDWMNWWLVRCLHLLGTRFKVQGLEKVPEGVPLIIVSNHQSLYDIAPLGWYFRKFHPKFVSKKELEYGVPSVSFNLRHGGSVCIDRKDPKQAITEIKKLAQYIEQYRRTAVIFPEGTRSRNGVPKKFNESGLKMLFKYAPSAWVVPVSINNSWKLLQYGAFPLSVGHLMTFDIHEPIAVAGNPAAELIAKSESAVVSGIRLN